jgi:predicted O-methyltransferase YrrM
MTFTENWFDTPSCTALAQLVCDVSDIPGRIVEIGSWEGRSTIAMANATRRNIHAVDTWAGSPGEISAALAGERDVYATWRSNIDEATAGNVVEHRMGWRDYACEDDSPVALLFIDAEHTYEEVWDTIETFRPWMSPGGIVCGDDVHHPPIIQAVAEWFPGYTTEATLWIARLP